MKYIVTFLFFTMIVFSQSKLDEANKLILKSKFNEAADLLETFVKDNNNADAYLKLGLCYKNLMLNNHALEAIERANELDPNNVDILSNLASLYSTMGFENKSITTFQKVIELDSTNIFAKINLAKFYIDSGRWSDAKFIYNNLVMDDSDNSFYHRQLGYIYQKEEDWHEAHNHYKFSYGLNPTDLFTISNLAKVFYQREQPDSAIAIIDKGLEIFVNNSQLLKLKSDIYFSLKNYSGSVNAIVRLIANGDESAQLYQRLGICYYQIAVENFVGDAQIQKLESAIEALNKSANFDSTQSLTELYLGMTYKELNKNEKAIAHLENAHKLIYPSFTPAIFTNLAIANNRIGNHANAIKNFKNAMRFDSTNPNYYYYLATTYDQYYYDKQVPYIYYNKFLASGVNIEPSLKNYTIQRIEELKESLHFQRGVNAKK